MRWPGGSKKNLWWNNSISKASVSIWFLTISRLYSEQQIRWSHFQEESWCSSNSDFGCHFQVCKELHLTVYNTGTECVTTLLQAQWRTVGTEAPNKQSFDEGLFPLFKMVIKTGMVLRYYTSVIGISIPVHLLNIFYYSYFGFSAVQSWTLCWQRW